MNFANFYHNAIDYKFIMHILSQQVLLGNQTHNIGFVRAMLNQLSYSNKVYKFSRNFQLMEIFH